MLKDVALMRKNSFKKMAVKLFRYLREFRVEYLRLKMRRVNTVTNTRHGLACRR